MGVKIIIKRKAQSVKRKIKAQNLKFLVLSFSFALCALSFSLPCSCFASSEAEFVKKGNVLYNNGKFEEALKNYNQALTQRPDSPVANFNAGNSLYKKSQYKEAIESYQKALLSQDKTTEAKANYNIGNSKYRQGKQKESSDLSTAIADYRQSLDYYKRAIELDPDDKDAKFNHEFVEKLLKPLLDKASKQKQKDKENQGQQGKELQQSDQEQQQKEEQAKQDQARQAEGDRQQNNKESEDKKQQGQTEQNQKEAEGPQQPRGVGGNIKQEDRDRGKDMSKEEAMLLLDDYRQKEQQERQLNDRHEPPKYPDVEKDW